MNRSQLKGLIESTLKEIDLYSPAAVNLLLGTAAQESHMGEYIKQLGCGPALGIFQMEPNTFTDIVENFLYYNPSMLGAAIAICNVKELNPESLRYNLKVAIIFCRFHYRRVPEPLPSTIPGMAAYWKKYYNTPLGKGTEDEFVLNYEKFVTP